VLGNVGEVGVVFGVVVGGDPGDVACVCGDVCEAWEVFWFVDLEEEFPELAEAGTVYGCVGSVGEVDGCCDVSNELDVGFHLFEGSLVWCGCFGEERGCVCAGNGSNSQGVGEEVQVGCGFLEPFFWLMQGEVWEGVGVAGVFFSGMFAPENELVFLVPEFLRVPAASFYGVEGEEAGTIRDFGCEVSEYGA